MEPIGLIAGNGKFPFCFAKCAKSNGRIISAVFLKGETDEKLADFVDKYEWSAIGNISRIMDFFKKEKIKQAVMAGQVKHNKIYLDMFLDFRAVKLMASLKDKRTDTILKAVADEFNKEGIEFMPSVMFLKELMPGAGILTRSKPSKSEQNDIEFGYRIAKELSGLDLGQSVVVKDTAVAALEAIEGTDACIIRGGRLAAKPGEPSNVVVVKVSKPRQDPRFDVPVLGIKTIEAMIKAEARVLAFEAGKTLFMDKNESVELADKNNICIVGI